MNNHIGNLGLLSGDDVKKHFGEHNPLDEPEARRAIEELNENIKKWEAERIRHGNSQKRGLDYRDITNQH